MTVKKNKAIELPEVNFSEDGESRYLHLGTPWIQGAMKIKEPFDLDFWNNTDGPRYPEALEQFLKERREARY